jgi:hypothetical protein
MSKPYRMKYRNGARRRRCRFALIWRGLLLSWLENERHWFADKPRRSCHFFGAVIQVGLTMGRLAMRQLAAAVSALLNLSGLKRTAPAFKASGRHKQAWKVYAAYRSRVEKLESRGEGSSPELCGELFDVSQETSAPLVEPNHSLRVGKVFNRRYAKSVRLRWYRIEYSERRRYRAKRLRHPQAK